jgi:hypothetical protein
MVKWPTLLRVCPGHERTMVELQRKVDGEWVKLKEIRLNEQCKGTFTLRANFKKGTFRAYWHTHHVDHRNGYSRPHVITTVPQAR